MIGMTDGSLVAAVKAEVHKNDVAKTKYLFLCSLQSKLWQFKKKRFAGQNNVTM